MGGCQGGPWGAWGTRSHSTGIIDRDLSPPHGWKGQGSAPVLVRGGRIWGVDAKTLRSAPQPWGGVRWDSGCSVPQTGGRAFDSREAARSLILSSVCWAYQQTCLSWR